MKKHSESALRFMYRYILHTGKISDGLKSPRCTQVFKINSNKELTCAFDGIPPLFNMYVSLLISTSLLPQWIKFHRFIRPNDLPR